jgi:hypothetical protein
MNAHEALGVAYNGKKQHARRREGFLTMENNEQWEREVFEEKEAAEPAPARPPETPPGSSAPERHPVILALDIILLVLENLLAYRVVLDFLGGQSTSTIVHTLTDGIVAPLNRLWSGFLIRSDSSVLEISAVILVFLLVYLHGKLDRSAARIAKALG